MLRVALQQWFSSSSQQQLLVSKSPSRVSPLAADEYSPALSVDSTVPPSLLIADSNDNLVLVEGS